MASWEVFYFKKYLAVCFDFFENLANTAPRLEQPEEIAGSGMGGMQIALALQRKDGRKISVAGLAHKRIA